MQSFDKMNGGMEVQKAKNHYPISYTYWLLYQASQKHIKIWYI
jgi:hypothetical protein